MIGPRPSQCTYCNICWVVLIIAAILIGNSAYEAGNISGGVVGLNSIFPNTIIDIGGISLNYLNVIIGLVAFLMLFIGNYKIIERALVSLVVMNPDPDILPTSPC